MPRFTPVLIIAIFLTACGGGGGNPSPVVPAGPGLVPALGDFYSYQEQATQAYTANNVTTPASATVWYVDVTSATGGDGSWIDTRVQEPPAATRMDRSFSADGGLTSVTDAKCRKSYTAPYYASQKNLAVGASWVSTGVRSGSADCTNPQVRNATQFSSSGTVLAQESVSVAAGTFNSFKLSISEKITFFDQTVQTITATHWIDADSHRLLKSSEQMSYTYSNGATLTEQHTTQLVGYNAGKTRGQRLNVERFAGPWSGSYSGSYSGNCSGEIYTDGRLDASCGGGAFAVHGTIDASGKINFALSAGGQTGPVFSGQFDSPLTITGTWTSGDGGSGTWTLNHL